MAICPRILYCTGNEGKFGEGKQALERLSKAKLRVEQRDPSVTEVQGSAREVACAKATSAMRELRRSGELYSNDVVLTEDVGVELGCLNGFPGCFIKVRGHRRHGNTLYVGIPGGDGSDFGRP